MAAQARQHEVEQNQRRQQSLRVTPSTLTIRGKRRRELGLAQGAVQEVGVERLVFNDLDDPRTHSNGPYR